MFSTFSNISILLKNCQIFPWYFPGRNTPLLAKIKFQYSWTSLIFLLLHIFNYFQMFQYSCRSLICFCLHIFQLLSNILILKCLNIFQIFEKIFPKNLPERGTPTFCQMNFKYSMKWNKGRRDTLHSPCKMNFRISCFSKCETECDVPVPEPVSEKFDTGKSLGTETFIFVAKI